MNYGEINLTSNNYPYDWCFGIVNGALRKVENRSWVTYRAESDDSLLIIERCCAKQVLNHIKDNYPDIIFKIYQVKNFEKSDKYYYVINGQILNYALKNFILVEIPKIGETFTLFTLDDLYQIKSIFKNEEIKISVYENGKIKEK